MPYFCYPTLLSKAQIPWGTNSLQMSQDFTAEHAEATEDKLEFLCALGVLCGEYVTRRFGVELCQTLTS
jgi:hypothetical protein